MSRHPYGSDEEASEAMTAELGVLVMDRWVLMRRHSLAQWHSWKHGLADWIQDAVLLMQRPRTHEPTLLLMCKHIDALLPLVMAGAGIDRAFFKALSPDDGELLLWAWWCANGCHFAALEIYRSWGLTAKTDLIH